MGTEIRISLGIISFLLFMNGCATSRSCVTSSTEELLAKFTCAMKEEQYKNPVMLRHEGTDWYTDEGGYVQIVHTYRVLSSFKEIPRPGDYLVCSCHYEEDIEEMFGVQEKNGRGLMFCSFDMDVIDSVTTNSLINPILNGNNDVNFPRRTIYYSNSGITPLPGCVYWCLTEDVPEELYIRTFRYLHRKTQND